MNYGTTLNKSLQLLLVEVALTPGPCLEPAIGFH